MTTTISAKQKGFNFKQVADGNLPLVELILIQRWLRDSHNLHIDIGLDQTSYPKFSYDIIKYNGIGDFERKTNLGNWGLYRSYELALEAAIIESIEYI